VAEPLRNETRKLSEAERERYDAVKRTSYQSAKRAADSLKRDHKPRTPYSIHKETVRLHKVGANGVRPVSANTIRNNELCAPLLTDPETRRVFKSADGPRDMDRMTREEAIEQAKLDRAWALDCSERLIEADNENARLRLENRELRKRV
jgi:hypothetical protein